ncbi:MAG: hypothetical protein R3E39_06540 [Anaerolineae bacterium]
MCNVLIYAVPFGFGPTGKAITIATELHGDHNVKVTTYGIPFALLDKSLSSVVVVDCLARDVHLWPTNLLDGIDVFFSLMDLKVAEMVKALKPEVKIVFIDSLLWWISHQITIPPYIDCYIAQYFPGIEQTIAARLPNPIHVVSPITKLAPHKSNNVQNSVVVHLGGISSPVLPVDSYLDFLSGLAEVLLQLAQQSSFQWIVTGNPNAMAIMQHQLDATAIIRFECLAHDEFVQLISESICFVTTPGIEATFDSFSMGIPTVFLPPMNSTQLGQILVFRENGFPIALSTAHITELHEMASLGITYQEETLQLSSFVNNLAIKSKKEFSHLLSRLLSRLFSSQAERERLIATQFKFLPTHLPNGMEFIQSYLNTVCAKNMSADSSVSHIPF